MKNTYLSIRQNYYQTKLLTHQSWLSHILQVHFESQNFSSFLQGQHLVLQFPEHLHDKEDFTGTSAVSRSNLSVLAGLADGKSGYLFSL